MFMKHGVGYVFLSKKYKDYMYMYLRAATLA